MNLANIKIIRNYNYLKYEGEYSEPYIRNTVLFNCSNSELTDCNGLFINCAITANKLLYDNLFYNCSGIINDCSGLKLFDCQNINLFKCNTLEFKNIYDVESNNAAGLILKCVNQYNNPTQYPVKVMRGNYYDENWNRIELNISDLYTANNTGQYTTKYIGMTYPTEDIPQKIQEWWECQ